MSPLHQMGDAIREMLLGVPLGAARAIFLLLLLALLIWVLCLPRAQVIARGSNGKLSENLKIWAALSLIIQLLIYALL